MTHPKFTPGPWTAEVHVISLEDPRLFGTIIDSNGNSVDYLSLRQEALVANATLIAAAPDMYEALEATVAYRLSRPVPFADHDCRWCNACVDQMNRMQNEALAKAGRA